jgi:uncharacterized protein (DUF302 family)
MIHEQSAGHELGVSRRRVAVEHVTIRTRKDYQHVKADLEQAVKRLDDTARAMLQNDDIAGLRERLRQIAGTAGLAIHYVGPHGDWLALQGSRRNCCSYFIGNVLYAVQMTSHDLAAGLYAPLRVVIYESDDGGCVAEYDRPSTQFGQFGHSEISAVARELDDKLHSLLLRVCQSSKET